MTRIITFTPGFKRLAMLVMPVPSLSRRINHWMGICLTCTGLAACGSFNNASNSIASIVTPYKVEVVQGNFVSKEQVEALRPGMSRGQVRDILGSPLVSSVFHADRWDYVFTIRRQGVEAQSRKLAVFFKGDELEKFDGDTMPSETEFLTKLDTHRKLGKVPNLEASPEELAKAQGVRATEPTPAAPAPVAPVVPLVYPPLEAAGR
jgi:outer membrane protein assembly factor BamE